MTRTRIATAAGLLSLVSSIGAAAADAPPPETGVTGGLLQAVLGLAVVLALIWGAAWVMRRLQPNIGSQHGALKLIASQGVGQRERIVVVEIAEQWLVVGVAPGNVNAIATLPKGAVPPTAPVTNTFSGFLARARGQARG